ncbi:MAG TPA: YicC/YloC family endoribonuclease, partial [Casimicrobiaceae bacterium]|nr:YicC/YloC family endoribonuclease [Casimicrobiaceae bacterium]
MILSMTGFAAVAAELAGVALTAELRSVNHRYLDLQVKLPEELRTLEPGLREQLVAGLRRGKVECRVSLSRSAAGEPALAVDSARVAELSRAAADAMKSAPGARPLSIGEILRWPGVIAEPTVPPDELAAHARKLVAQALAELNASRAREGTKLVATLVERCDAIEAQVGRIAPRVPAIHATYIERLAARLKEAGLDPDQDRLKQELALFATKVDVAEELSRLSTHVAEVRRV